MADNKVNRGNVRIDFHERNSAKFNQNQNISTLTYERIFLSSNDTTASLLRNLLYCEEYFDCTSNRCLLVILDTTRNFYCKLFPFSVHRRSFLSQSEVHPLTLALEKLGLRFQIEIVAVVIIKICIVYHRFQSKYLPIIPLVNFVYRNHNVAVIDEL